MFELCTSTTNTTTIHNHPLPPLQALRHLDELDPNRSVTHVLSLEDDWEFVARGFEEVAVRALARPGGGLGAGPAPCTATVLIYD